MRLRLETVLVSHIKYFMNIYAFISLSFIFPGTDSGFFRFSLSTDKQQTDS